MQGGKRGFTDRYQVTEGRGLNRIKERVFKKASYLSKI
jgi:hypothetical protein